MRFLAVLGKHVSSSLEHIDIDFNLHGVCSDFKRNFRVRSYQSCWEWRRTATSIDMWVAAENVRRNHLLLHVSIALIENICVAERWDSTIFDRECYDRTDKTLNNLPPTVDAVGFQVSDSDFRMILMKSLLESGTKYILYHFASFVRRKTHQTCRETTRRFKHQHKIFCILEMDMDRFISLVESLGWNVDAILSCSCWLGYLSAILMIVSLLVFVGFAVPLLNQTTDELKYNILEATSWWMYKWQHHHTFWKLVFKKGQCHIRGRSWTKHFVFICLLFGILICRLVDQLMHKKCVYEMNLSSKCFYFLFFCVFVHKHDFCRGANHKCH